MTTNEPDIVLLHGLTFDHRQWDPVVHHLGLIAPGRRVLALDLPGHGATPGLAGYRAVEVADALHEMTTAAGVSEPVLAGHSLGGVLATVYASRYPVRAVVNVDQPVLTGGFGTMLREAEPVLAGARWHEIWERLLAGMGVGELPPEARMLVRTGTRPRQDLLLGYWSDILRLSDAELTAQREHELAVIGARDVPYVFVSGREPDPAYTQWLIEALPKARIEVLAGSGHFPHLAHPADVASIIAGLG